MNYRGKKIMYRAKNTRSFFTVKRTISVFPNKLNMIECDYKMIEIEYFHGFLIELSLIRVGYFYFGVFPNQIEMNALKIAI